MPALPDAPNIVRVRVAGANNGTGWMNQFHLRYAGAAPSTANLDAVAASVLSSFATNFLPLCHAGVTLANASAQDLTNAAAAQGAATNTSPGTRTGTAMTNQVACVVSWKINVRYRGGHPRTYLPAGVLGDTTAGHLWTDTFVNAVTTGATAFRSAMNSLTTGGATWSMVALSYYRNHVLLVPPVPYTVASALCHHRVDTQRNRLGTEVP